MKTISELTKGLTPTNSGNLRFLKNNPNVLNYLLELLGADAEIVDQLHILQDTNATLMTKVAALTKLNEIKPEFNGELSHIKKSLRDLDLSQYDNTNHDPAIINNEVITTTTNSEHPLEERFTTVKHEGGQYKIRLAPSAPPLEEGFTTVEHEEGQYKISLAPNAPFKTFTTTDGHEYILPIPGKPLPQIYIDDIASMNTVEDSAIIGVEPAYDA